MRETRVIHAADIHLGARPMRLEEREADIMETFTQLVELVMEERPRALLIAGDLFDTPRPDARFVKHALTNLRRLAEKGIAIIAAHGEHDTPGRPQATILQVLETALAPHFKAPLGLGASTLEELVEQSMVRLSDLTVLVFPFRRGPLDGRRQLASQVAEAYRTIAPREENPTVMLGHFSLTTVLPFDALLSPQELPPVDYVALGHVHQRRITPPQDNMPAHAYPGSLEALNMDEARQTFPRGPLIVDLTRHGEPRVQEAPLETRPHVFAEARVGGLLGLSRDLQLALQSALSSQPRGRGKPPLVLLRVTLAPGVAARAVEAEAQRLARRAGVLLRLLVEPSSGEGGEAPGGGGVSVVTDPREMLVRDLGLPPGAAELVMEVQRTVLEGQGGALVELLERLSSEYPGLFEKIVSRRERG